MGEKRLEPRWPWYLAGGLFLGAGVATGVAAWLLWLPCRGHLLDGTILVGYRSLSTSDFTDACNQAMDSGGWVGWPSAVDAQTTGLLAASGTAMCLLAAAWLVLVLSFCTTPLARLIGAGPGLANLVIGALLLMRGVDVGPADLPDAVLIHMAIDLTAVLAIGAIAVTWGDDIFGLGRASLALAGVASMGVAGPIFDYVAMTVLSDNNWDTPPGTGFLTAGFQVFVGVALVVLTATDNRRSDAPTLPSVPTLPSGPTQPSGPTLPVASATGPAAPAQPRPRLSRSSR